MKKKILVTGGTGYIGSHTVIELINQGYDVLIIDNLSNSEELIIDRIEQITGVAPSFVRLNLLDKNLLNEFINKNTDIEGVIHFTAAKAVGESVKNPIHYYRNNIVGLINLLKMMIKYRIKNIVFSSSCAVYGQPDILPVTEDTSVKSSESPYGYTKQVCESVLKNVVNSCINIQGITLRYFNPIGAHESGLIGELPIGVPANLVPFITQTAYGIQKQLSVFGDNYNTLDGSCIRDYTHVVDLARAHSIAIERLTNKKNKKKYEMFNLGTGNGISVFEIIKSFEKVSGLKLNFVVDRRRKGDVEQIWADTSYANKELGWKAKKNIDEMTLSAWKWEQNFRKKKI